MGIISSQCRWLSTGTDCPERLRDLQELPGCDLGHPVLNVPAGVQAGADGPRDPWQPPSVILLCSIYPLFISSYSTVDFFFLIIHRIRWKEYYVSNRSETRSTDSSNIFIIAVTMIIAITIAISIAITINSIKVDTTTKPLWKVILNNHYIYCKCAFHFFWILTLKYIYIVSESFLHLPLAPSWALFDLIICLCMTSQSVAMERAVISNK